MLTLSVVPVSSGACEHPRMYDAVIVGAGVGGLAAAHAAGQIGGARVLVVDRHRQPVDAHKGEFLQPRTLEILDGWGVTEELVDTGAVRIDGLECRDARGAYLGALDYSRLAHDFNCGMLQYYARIQDLLLVHARRVSEVRFGARATGLLRLRDGRVAGVTIDGGASEREIQAKLVVGADGATSAVRGWAGIACRRRPYDHQFVAFDLDAAGLPARIVNFLTRQGARIVYPMPGGHCRLYVQVPAARAAELRKLDAASWRAELLRTCPALGDLLELRCDGLERRQWFAPCRTTAERWTRPGLVLTGDAAHLIHPMAGQGMNAAIVDGWMVFDVLRRMGGFRTARQIDVATRVYEQLRRPQVQVVDLASHRLSLLCTATSRLGHGLARHALVRNRRNHRLVLAATATMAGVQPRRFTALEWFQVLSGVGSPV